MVYSYYIDSDQQCVAQITLIARKYDETNFLEELQRSFSPEPSAQDGEEKSERRGNGWNRRKNRPNQPAEQTVP